MNAEDFRVAQARINCTNLRLAKWLGVSHVTVSNWRTGRRPVTGPVALAVKALADGWRP